MLTKDYCTVVFIALKHSISVPRFIVFFILVDKNKEIKFVGVSRACSTFALEIMCHNKSPSQPKTQNWQVITSYILFA